MDTPLLTNAILLDASYRGDGPSNGARGATAGNGGHYRHTQARWEQDCRRKQHCLEEVAAGIPHQRRGSCNQAVWNIAQKQYKMQPTVNLEVGAPVLDAPRGELTAVQSIENSVIELHNGSTYSTKAGEMDRALMPVPTSQSVALLQGKHVVGHLAAVWISYLLKKLMTMKVACVQCSCLFSVTKCMPISASSPQRTCRFCALGERKPNWARPVPNWVKMNYVQRDQEYITADVLSLVDVIAGLLRPVVSTSGPNVSTKVEVRTPPWRRQQTTTLPAPQRPEVRTPPWRHQQTMTLPAPQTPLVATEVDELGEFANWSITELADKIGDDEVDQQMIIERIAGCYAASVAGWARPDGSSFLTDFPQKLYAEVKAGRDPRRLIIGLANELDIFPDSAKQIWNKEAKLWEKTIDWSQTSSNLQQQAMENIVDEEAKRPDDNPTEVEKEWYAAAELDEKKTLDDDEEVQYYRQFMEEPEATKEEEPEATEEEEELDQAGEATDDDEYDPFTTLPVAEVVVPQKRKMEIDPDEPSAKHARTVAHYAVVAASATWTAEDEW